jgi:hypothetical protein
MEGSDVHAAIIVAVAVGSFHGLIIQGLAKAEGAGKQDALRESVQTG